eukprot:TRINITY_DN14464_c0_g1_i1.p1 TRINITY_DN14464_c0_g1~~TRINITY_DN14464_c0_g1_i1.p1  ORF type:complete len:194 (-),score=44.36 TRINITY_DN14464_c0_g1_i1:51-632(-)
MLAVKPQGEGRIRVWTGSWDRSTCVWEVNENVMRKKGSWLTGKVGAYSSVGIVIEWSGVEEGLVDAVTAMALAGADIKLFIRLVETDMKGVTEKTESITEALGAEWLKRVIISSDLRMVSATYLITGNIPTTDELKGFKQTVICGTAAPRSPSPNSPKFLSNNSNNSNINLFRPIAQLGSWSEWATVVKAELF